MKRTRRQYIADILEMMAYAERFAGEMSREELEHDVKTQFALQRCFSIIGEAANKVDPTFRTKYTSTGRYPA